MCTFKINLFVQIKKDVFRTSWKKLSFTWTRFNYNFYSWGRLFSAYFQRNILISRQILWHVWRPVKSLDTFCKRFEILAPSWIDTRLLIKLRGGIKRNRVWMKKNFSKKFRNGETKSHRRRKKLTAAGKGEMFVGYVWFVKLRWKLADLICEAELKLDGWNSFFKCFY